MLLEIMCLQGNESSNTRARLKVIGLAYVKLGTSGRWVGTRIGTEVTAKLRLCYFLVAAHGSMGIGGSIG